MPVTVNNVPDIWAANANGIHYTDGYVGIGTNAPDQPLTVFSQDLGYMAAFRYFRDHSSGAVLRMYKARGTAAAPRRARSSDVIGGFNIFGYEAVDDATDAVNGAVSFQFQAGATEAYTSTTKGSSFKINLCPTGSATPANRLYIYNDGTLTHFNIPGLPTGAGAAPGGLVAGDLWVDTSAGNTLKVV